MIEPTLERVEQYIREGRTAELMPGFVVAGPNVRGRQCGTCTLCCTLVPVELHDEHKEAGVKCKHERNHKCGIYKRRPVTCASWSCRWLLDDRTHALQRPDKSHYIIDPLLDIVTAADNIKVYVMQVWVDPAYPDAHRDPPLRDYLQRMYDAYGVLTLVRIGNEAPHGRGIMLIPPSKGHSTTQWIEHESNLTGPGDNQFIRELMTIAKEITDGTK